MDHTFITPEGHKGFLAKKLFSEMGKIQWGAIAYIEENGGGPENNHTHSDDHILSSLTVKCGSLPETERSLPARIRRYL